MLRAPTPNSASMRTVGWRRLVLLFAAVLLTAAPIGCKRKKPPVPTPPAPIPQGSTQQPPAPTVNSGSNAPPLSPHQKVEEEVIELLGSGKQSEAEERLAEELGKYPGLERIVSIMGRNRDTEVKKILREQFGGFRDQQRLLFLQAACVRSRFDVIKAWQMFLTVFVIDQTTVWARCADQVAFLDSKVEEHGPGAADRAFAELTRLADATNDVVIRWMLAVQCRNWNKNELGAQQFAKLLEKWKPGPVLVHQTYANILDELKQFEKALVERRLAVKMEPAGWSYDGLGNTLKYLKRYDEALEAHAKAIELDPRRASYWSNWASTLLATKDYEESIAKCQKSLSLDKDYWHAWLIWGDCLQAQGHNEMALEKYQKVLAINPKHPDIRLKIAALMK